MMSRGRSWASIPAERRAHVERERWPWPRRALYSTGRWIFNLLIGPFLTKLPDGTIQASMTRISVAAFMVVECYRLMPQPGPGDLRLVPVIGWPDAFLAFFVLFALAIDKAMTTLAERNPEKLVETLLGRMGIGEVAGRAFSGFTGPANEGAPGGDA